MATASASYATDSVNAAFFLEWASPNQIAKVDKAYDDAMGVDVNWTDFSTGVQMTEAMLSGDIDISYSQGLAPFVTAIQQGAPLKMVAVAMMYEANDCFVKNGLGIDASNASELEGKTVAVPLNTMADFAFKSYMNHLDVDMSTMTIVDQAPADGAVSLADGSVDMACIFGGNSSKAAGEVGTPIMTSEQKVEAGIGSFDVVSVTEKFATENPDLLRTFLDVTDEANKAWAFTDEQLAALRLSDVLLAFVRLSVFRIKLKAQWADVVVLAQHHREQLGFHIRYASQCFQTGGRRLQRPLGV